MVAETRGTSALELVKKRESYDFSEFTLEDDEVEVYYQQSDEVTKILQDVENRHKTNKLPRYLVGGPTASGKSLLAKVIANRLNCPFIEIQCKYSMNELDLLGSPKFVGGDSYWTDGPLTKALLASQEGPVVLLLDEVNRARPQSKAVLLPALDSRATVTIEPRGGEVISGSASNLIVIGTINEGSEYITESMDKAEKRRFNIRFNLNYLGEERPDAEIRTIVDKTTIPGAIALEMVGVANTLREEGDNDDSAIDHGLPTSNLLSWARTSLSYEKICDDPVTEAARDTVVNSFYQDNEQAQSRVEEIINTRLAGAPVLEGEELYKWVSQEDDPTLPFESIEDLQKQYETSDLISAGVPSSVARRMEREGLINTGNLVDSKIGNKTIMHLAKNI